MKKLSLIIGILVIVFSAFPIFAIGRVEDVSAIGVGDPAPFFSLMDAISGNTIGLANYKGKIVLLDFFATWCEPCRRAIDNDLVPLHNQFYADDPNVMFLSIDLWEPERTKEELRAFASDHSMKWPILMGSNSNIDKDYGVEGVPTICIIDGNGVIRHYHLGSPGAATLKNEIDVLRAAVDVTWGLGTIQNPPSPYCITIMCNHTVTSFNLSKQERWLSFTIMADDFGLCNITIPRNRFDGPFKVTLNYTIAIHTVDQNSTHSNLSFAYTLGTHYVKITGTERGYIIGDLNGDGEVNLKDIFIAAKNYGHKEEDYNP